MALGFLADLGRIGVVDEAVFAGQRIEITAQGRVNADLETPSLMIEDGAFFEGRCSMGKRSQTTAERPVVAQMPLNKER